MRNNNNDRPEHEFCLDDEDRWYLDNEEISMKVLYALGDKEDCAGKDVEEDDHARQDFDLGAVDAVGKDLNDTHGVSSPANDGGSSSSSSGELVVGEGT